MLKLTHLLIYILSFWSIDVFAQKHSQPFDPELLNALNQSIQDMSSYSDRFEAEVWLKDMSNRLTRYVKDPIQRVNILKLVHEEAQRVNIKPEVVLALIEVESHFEQFAISVSGARGLMQVMPFWLKELKMENENLFHLHINIRMGTTILKFYLDKEKGNLNNALARYNGSYGKNKYPDKVFKALRTHWFSMN